MKPGSLKRRLSIAAAVCAVSGYICSWFGGAHHWWDTIPLFWSLFGFVGCGLLIYGAVGLGKLFIQQPENFYDD